MLAQKRVWILGGLAHPSGVALARPAVEGGDRVPGGSTVLLVGDKHVRGLGPTLRQLCASKAAKLVTIELDFPAKETSVHDAAGRIMVEAARVQPTLVLVSIPWKSPVSSLEFKAAACKLGTLRRRGRTVAWLRSPQQNSYSDLFRRILDEARMPSFHSEALQLPMGPDATPTAEGYAGWAGALWRWLK